MWYASPCNGHWHRADTASTWRQHALGYVGVEVYMEDSGCAEKGLLVDEERFGELPSKRQRRQRFELQLNDSDVDSENGGDTAYNAEAVSESSDDNSDSIDTSIRNGKRVARVHDPLDLKPALSRYLMPRTSALPQPNGVSAHSCSQGPSPVRRILPVLQPWVSPTPQYAPSQLQHHLHNNVYQPQRPLPENLRNQGAAAPVFNSISPVLPPNLQPTQSTVLPPLRQPPVSPLVPVPVHRSTPIYTISPDRAVQQLPFLVLHLSENPCLARWQGKQYHSAWCTSRGRRLLHHQLAGDPNFGW